MEEWKDCVLTSIHPSHSLPFFRLSRISIPAFRRRQYILSPSAKICIFAFYLSFILTANWYHFSINDNLGGYFGWLGLGWTVACLFSQEIFGKYQHFPILFNAGRYQSGKTTFSRWMMSVLGIETQGINISQTTQNRVQKLGNSLQSKRTHIYRDNNFRARHQRVYR